VNAHPGDTIRVTAICVLGGTLEKVYDIPAPIHPTTTGTSAASGIPATSMLPATVPTTAKAPLDLLPLPGAVAAVLLIKRL